MPEEQGRCHQSANSSHGLLIILHNIHYAQSRKRRRLWYISPEGFRELRHSCLLSRQRAADYLGVSVRTIRHWDAGRNRVPWSAVRLLRGIGA